jgi:hypothetical protein
MRVQRLVLVLLLQKTYICGSNAGKQDPPKVLTNKSPPQKEVWVEQGPAKESLTKLTGTTQAS